jgi:nucleotide-binding universal stress UspA family protein
MKRFRNILVIAPESASIETLAKWLGRLGAASSPQGVDLMLVASRFYYQYPAQDDYEPQVDAEMWREKIGSALDNIPLSVELHSGDPLRRILERLAEGKFDLVVTPINDLDSRIMAERLTRKSPVGVLAVTDDSKPAVSDVLVGVDFSDLSKLCLDWAEAFSTIGGDESSRLEMMHLDDLPPRSRATMAMTAEALAEQVHETATDALNDLVTSHSRNPSKWEQKLVAGQWPGEALTRRASEGDFDLLVVGSHGRSALTIALLGSHASEVLRHCDRPVLVVKNKNENLQFVRGLLGLPN